MIHALADNDIHRVYVVDTKEGRQIPAGVVTPTDILRLLSGISDDASGRGKRAAEVAAGVGSEGAAGAPYGGAEAAAAADGESGKKAKA